MNMIPPLETDSTTAIILPRERRARTSLILHQPSFMPLSYFAVLRPAEKRKDIVRLGHLPYLRLS